VELIKAGFYKDVDISIMAHPSIFDGCFLPTVACHSFTVEYFGKAAHASIAPWDGINALDAMVEAYNGLNALRQSLRPSMRIAGSILEGGKYDNLIPYSAISRLTKLGTTLRVCFHFALARWKISKCLWTWCTTASKPPLSVQAAN